MRSSQHTSSTAGREGAVGRSRSRRTRPWALTATVGLVVAALVPAASASAASGEISGNSTCRQLLGDPTAYEIKVETPDIENGAQYGPITVTGVNDSADGHDPKTLMGFVSTVPIDAVFVKGGPVGGWLYDYRPAGSSADSNMGTGGYGVGRHQISHVSFCWHTPPTTPPAALGVSKTADGTHTRRVTWNLTKTVDVASHTGRAGQVAGSSLWSVTATKDVAHSYAVTGTITVTNPTASPVAVRLADTLDDTPATTAAITCPVTGDATGTVPAADSAGPGELACTYTASPAGSTATTNNVVVTSLTDDVPGATAIQPVAWTVTTIGDDSVTLADPRFGYPSVPGSTVNATTTVTFPETFSCPASPSLYTGGLNSRQEQNTATLTGPSTTASASATVAVECRRGAPETATGAGPRWPGTSNWFMYTPYPGLTATGEPKKVDLIAGQHHDAGDVWIVRTTSPTGTVSTTIRITLDPRFEFDNVLSNVKIHPMTSAPTKYLSPGSFKHKFTVTGRTVELPVDTANFYGIHVDTLRYP